MRSKRKLMSVGNPGQNSTASAKAVYSAIIPKV
jgi:hypothetical protein